jgi:hypothetical protein
MSEERTVVITREDGSKEICTMEEFLTMQQEDMLDQLEEKAEVNTSFTDVENGTISFIGSQEGLAFISQFNVESQDLQVTVFSPEDLGTLTGALISLQNEMANESPPKDATIH